MNCQLRFAGQYADSESGLYYNRYRYYNPAAGQYISPDPIGLLGGFNPYGYVGLPTEWIDFFGLNVQTGEGRTHVTYHGVKYINGIAKPYTGYASAPTNLGLTAEQIVSRRYGGNFSGFSTSPRVLYSGIDQAGKQTSRGLEHRYYEQDVAKYGRENVANAQSPVGVNNKNRDVYLAKADEHLKSETIKTCKG